MLPMSELNPRLFFHVSNLGLTVERTEPSSYSDERQPAAGLKGIESSGRGGNYPLDLVLIRTIILMSSSFERGLRF